MSQYHVTIREIQIIVDDDKEKLYEKILKNADVFINTTNTTGITQEEPEKPAADNSAKKQSKNKEKQKIHSRKCYLKKQGKLTPEAEAELNATLAEIEQNRKKTYEFQK